MLQQWPPSLLFRFLMFLLNYLVICCEVQESNLVSSAYETEMIFRFTHPQYMYLKYPQPPLSTLSSQGVALLCFKPKLTLWEWYWVAGVGFEPHDLQVMSLTSYLCSTPQFMQSLFIYRFDCNYGYIITENVF